MLLVSCIPQCHIIIYRNSYSYEKLAMKKTSYCSGELWAWSISLGFHCPFHPKCGSSYTGTYINKTQKIFVAGGNWTRSVWLRGERAIRCTTTDDMMKLQFNWSNCIIILFTAAVSKNISWQNTTLRIPTERAWTMQRE